MNCLTLLASTQGQNLSAGLFYLFALMSALSAIGVVISRNIVRTAVCLLFTLAGVAGLYFLLSAEFLAAVQLVVYAGGTLILIVFGVMLTSKSPFTRFEPKAAELVIALTVGVVLLVALIMAIPAGATAEPLAAGPVATSLTASPSLPESLRDRVTYQTHRRRLLFRGRMSDADKAALLSAVDAGATETGAADNANQVRAAIENLSKRSQRFFFEDRPLTTGENYPVPTLGQALLGDYLLPFEIVSVLLLAVMIGAAYLAKGRRHTAPPADGPSSGPSHLARQVY